MERLLQHIDAFENELIARKLSFAGVALLALTVMGGISDAGGATKTVRDVLGMIEQTIGLAKEEQDKEAAARMIPREEIRQLAPPRKAEPEAQIPTRLDDEIPF